MGTSNYSDEFKRDAVHQITVRGYPVREVSRRLGVSKYSLYKWLKLFGEPVPKPGVDHEAEGRPTAVSLPRWSNANPDKVFCVQPFGSYSSDFREAGGYRLPFHVAAGNMFGNEDHFPFFIAEMTAIRFPEGTP